MVQKQGLSGFGAGVCWQGPLDTALCRIALHLRQGFSCPVQNPCLHPREPQRQAGQACSSTKNFRAGFEATKLKGNPHPIVTEEILS